MPNYYEILGLPDDASILEIKSAFRALAKIYHPDKNPEGKECFEKILRAYETLSDPSLKPSYDYRLKHNQTEIREVKSSNRTTSPHTSERERKRKEYYDDYIRQYEKTVQKEAAETSLKQPYNEFKYILFATPLAVLLFLLIIQFAGWGNPNEPLFDIARSNSDINKDTCVTNKDNSSETGNKK